MTVVSGKSAGTITVTPNGIPVYYQSEPRRLYRIGDFNGHAFQFDPENLLSLAQSDAPSDQEMWREIPSVTTVLGVLDKPALPWWGQGVGAEGVTILHNLGLVKSTILPGGVQPVLTCPRVIDKKLTDEWVVAGKDQLVDLLNQQQLTVNHTVSKAGDRGQAVHDALEHWAQTGELPDPSIYPPTEVGYVQGLLAFFADVPSAEPVASEVLVASSEYGFAGRYDLRLRTTEEHDVVVHRTPKRGPQYRRLAPGELLADLKTSKGVYASHARQLEAYEQASIESGYPATTARAILHVSAEGEYELVKSWATFEDFRVVLDVWRSDQQMKLAEQAERKRAA